MAETSRLVLEVDSSGIIKAEGNLIAFANAAAKAENAASKTEHETRSLDDVFKNLNVSSLAAAAGVGGLVAAFASVAGAVKNFGSQAIGAYASFESLKSGLSSLMVNMGKGADAGDKLFESLRKFSNQTTFGVDTLAKASQLLLTSGVNTDQLNRKLTQLGNLAGGSTEKFNRLVDIYTKVLATGKAGSQEIQSLSALTGTSLVNALGKASASAEELDGLFASLTENGGMFEGAMDGLIDTIEGKQGFVTDNWTELLAGFAEASGLADAYKSALDTVSDSLATVVSWLQSINSNPVAKAMFQGVLVAALGAITGAILGGLIPALVTTISKLTIIAALKTAINPAQMLAGLAVGAGVAVGITALTKAMSAAKEESVQTKPTIAELAGQISTVGDIADTTSRSIQELTDQLVIQQNIMKSASVADMYSTGWSDSLSKTNDEIEKHKTKLRELRDEAEKSAKADFVSQSGNEIFNAGVYNKGTKREQKAANQWASENIDGYKNMSDGDRLLAYRDALASKLREYIALQKDGSGTITSGIMAQIKAEEEYIAVLEKEGGAYKDNIAKMDDVKRKKAEMDASSSFIDSVIGANQSEIDKITEKLQKLRDMYNQQVYSSNDDGTFTLRLATDDADFKERLDKAVALTEAELSKAKAKIKVSVELADWQKVLKSAMNFSDADVANGFLKSGERAVSEYSKKIRDTMSNLDGFAPDLGLDALDVAEESLDNIQSVIDAVARSGLWDKNERTVELLRQMKDAARDIVFDRTVDSLEKEYGLLKLSTEEMEKQKLIGEKGYTDDQAERLMSAQKRNEKQKNVQEARGRADDALAKMNLTAMTGGSDAEYRSARMDYLNANLNALAAAAEAAYHALGGLEEGTAEYEQKLAEFNAAGNAYSSAKTANMYTERENTRAESSSTARENVDSMLSNLGMVAIAGTKAEQAVAQYDVATAQYQAAVTEQSNAYQAMQDALSQFGTGSAEYATAVAEFKTAAGVVLDASTTMKEAAIKSNFETAKENGDVVGMLQSKADESALNFKNGEGSAGDAAQYAGATLAGGLAGASKELTAFAEGCAQGGVFMGLINAAMTGLLSALQGVEGVDEILNPFTTLFSNMKTMLEDIMNGIKPILSMIKTLARLLDLVAKIVRPITNALNALNNGIAWLFDTIVGGIETFLGWLGIVQETSEEQEEEDENLKKLNEQYNNLLTAMKSQEEAYLAKRSELNAQSADIAATGVRGVHDMILTPQGRFSTDPDDYIIATKNPSKLNGGGESSGAQVNVSFRVENNYADKVDVQVAQNDDNGMQEFVVTISKKVAADYASGNNGWDSAIAMQQYRQGGRNMVV